MTDAPAPGLLHTYTDKPTQLPLFETADVASSKCLIFLPGLFDGTQTVPYVAPLRGALQKAGWSLAQPHLTSSYKGFGMRTLEEDADQIEQAVDYLKSRGKKTIVLHGHSTGCQQIMTYLLSRPRSAIARAIIQAPASDRACVAAWPSKTDPIKLSQEAYDAAKARGTEKIELCSAELAKEFQLDAITPYRAWSLLCIGGDDDYFSNDIPLHPSPSAPLHRPLSQTFGLLPTSTPVLALFSEADECVPNAVATQTELSAKWTEAAPAGVFKGVMVPGASHNVKDPEAQRFLVSEVLQFITAQGGVEA